MENVTDFLDGVGTLSSNGLFGAAFDFLKASGSWAEAVSKLLGLL